MTSHGSFPYDQSRQFRADVTQAILVTVLARRRAAEAGLGLTGPQGRQAVHNFIMISDCASKPPADPAAGGRNDAESPVEKRAMNR